MHAALRNFWSDKTERYGAINTHDVIKFFALVTMTIDHVGAYCFPEQLWWRAVGRLSFPFWFFLVGHARSQDIPVRLVVLAVLLAVVHPFVGQPILPTNVLVSIILCRLAVRLAEQRGWLFHRTAELGAACAALWLPGMVFFEYGGLAIAIALWGAMVRHNANARLTHGFGLFCLIFAVLTQMIGDAYDPLQSLFIAGGLSACFWYLARFRICPVALGQQRSVWALAIRFLARQSLWYYAIHRVLLQAFGAYVMLRPKVDHFTWIALHTN